MLTVKITTTVFVRTTFRYDILPRVWWWIGVGAVAWMVVSIGVAIVVARVIRHADLEDEAEALRRTEHDRRLRNLFRRG
jgi:hypothetical protein